MRGFCQAQALTMSLVPHAPAPLCRLTASMWTRLWRARSSSALATWCGGQLHVPCLNCLGHDLHPPPTTLDPVRLQSHIELQNAEGFCDVGLQHPAASSPADAARFVCVPAARVSRPVTLQPGESWTGEMRLTAHNRYWELPPFEESDPSTIPLPPASEAIPSARWGGQSKAHILSGFEKKRARQ